VKNIRVLRGKITTLQNLPEGGAYRLIVDDGNFNDAWRVTKFCLAYDSPAHASPRDVVGVLATEEDAVRDTDIPTTVGWNWDDRRQIAWAGQDMQGTSSFESFPAPGLIDPTHVIVRELWIAVTGTLSTGNYCYYIELERVELDDNQAVMAMVSERNQRWL
jgi:hypothetical protein